MKKIILILALVSCSYTPKRPWVITAKYVDIDHPDFATFYYNGDHHTFRDSSKMYNVGDTMK